MLFTIEGVDSFLTLDVTLIVRGELIILCRMCGFLGVFLLVGMMYMAWENSSKRLPESPTEQLQGVLQKSLFNNNLGHSV